jgi:hypothetical protein
MKDECCLSPIWPMEKDPRMTQGQDYSIGTLNERGRVGTPAEVAAMNSTTSQKVAESGLVLRQPL